MLAVWTWGAKRRPAKSSECRRPLGGLLRVVWAVHTLSYQHVGAVGALRAVRGLRWAGKLVCLEDLDSSWIRREWRGFHLWSSMAAVGPSRWCPMRGVRDLAGATGQWVCGWVSGRKLISQHPICMTRS
eukprot:6652555-Pyramimonas_sp.AAC.1